MSLPLLAASGESLTCSTGATRQRRRNNAPLASSKINTAIPVPAPEMNIYVCIIPGKHFSRVGELPIAATAVGTAVWGAATANPGSAFPTRKNSEKIARFFATRTPTPPCVRMNIIHFPRAVIHQRPLARALRASEKSSRQQRKKRRNFDL